MAEGVDSRILDGDPRKVSQEVLDGPQDLTDGPLVTVLLCKGEGVAECVQGMRVRFFEARGPRPPKVDQVRSDPEGVAEVYREGADVRPRLTANPEEDIAPVDLQWLEFEHASGPLLPLHRGPDRRDLIDLPDEPGHHGPHPPRVYVLVELEQHDVLLVPREDRLDREGGVRGVAREDSRSAWILCHGMAL